MKNSAFTRSRGSVVRALASHLGQQTGFAVEGALQHGTKEGSVGRPLPGVTVKIVAPDTREALGTDKEGLLYVHGTNMMKDT